MLKVLDADFDFKAMARSSLGAEWKKLNDGQRKRYEAAFQKYMEARYVKIIESYSGQKIDFVKESTTGPPFGSLYQRQQPDAPESARFRLQAPPRKR